MLRYHSFGLFLILSLSLLSIPVQGFFPTTFREVVFGSDGTSHIKMTETAFESRAKAYFPSLTKVTKHMRKARDEITKANAKVDKNQVAAHWHCDGESFGDAQIRITKLKDEAVQALLADHPQVSLARENIGAALHTIQDFYAHSNWIEMKHREPNAELIRNGDMSYATFEDHTCDACVDFEPPFDWDYSVPFPCGGFDCKANTDGYEKLTSGYYFGEDVPSPKGSLIPPYKCHHGGPTDDPRGAIIGILRGTKPGINKDSNNCIWSPHASLHTDAADVATAATEQFFDDIKEALASDRALRLLFGVPSIAFAIDTTGSMGSIINSVRSEAISIASSLIGTDDEPGLYVVSPFNDPLVGPLTVTSDFAIFQSAINSLFADGGDDCPELSIAGMQSAIDVMDEGSKLLMFTDAAPKDFGASGALFSDAAKRHIQIDIYKYDSNCDDGVSGFAVEKRVDSQSNLVYGEICAVTGGLYHTGPRSDVTKISSVIKNLITANPVSILRAQGSLAGGFDTFSIPIDSYATGIIISLLGTGFTISVTQPDSTPLTASSPGISWNIFSTSVSITVSVPSHGLYSLVVSGTGSYTLNVNGVSSIQLSSFDFASIDGRPGHTGWFPLDGPPPYNQPIGAIAQIAGEFQTATFSFRAPSFALLSTAAMTAGSGEPGYPSTNDFFGILTVPTESFFVYVTGVDDKGLAYQRVLETPIIPFFTTTPFPLSTGQMLDLSNNVTAPFNITSPKNISSSTSKWGNSTAVKTSAGPINVYSTAGPFHYPTAPAYYTSAPAYLLSTSTICETKTYNIASCAPEIKDCPSRITTEIVTVGTTVCPVSLSTSTAYKTTSYVVSECPNMADNCKGLGAVTTRVLSVSETVVAVPVTTSASGGESSKKATAGGSGAAGSGGGASGTSAAGTAKTAPTSVVASGADTARKMGREIGLCVSLLGLIFSM